MTGSKDRGSWKIPFALGFLFVLQQYNCASQGEKEEEEEEGREGFEGEKEKVRMRRSGGERSLRRSHGEKAEKENEKVRRGSSRR